MRLQEELLRLLQENGWDVTRRPGELNHWAWFDEIWVVQSRRSPHDITLVLTLLVDPEPGNTNPFWLIGTAAKLPESSSEALGEPSLRTTPNGIKGLPQFIAGLNALRQGKRYSPARDAGTRFVNQVADWIRADGEVFVVLRGVGGLRDYALCSSRAEFERLVELVCDGTEVIAMRGRFLPIRGQVTEALIALAREAISDGSEYLAITLATKSDSRMAAGVAAGESHADLTEALRDWMGVAVAVGVCPDFWASDHEGLISRAKGGVEGPR